MYRIIDGFIVCVSIFLLGYAVLAVIQPVSWVPHKHHREEVGLIERRRDIVRVTRCPCGHRERKIVMRKAAGPLLIFVDSAKSSTYSVRLDGFGDWIEIDEGGTGK